MTQRSEKVALVTGGTSSIGLATAQRFVALGRVGTPDKIAKVVVFLASDNSSFVNGIELFIDGGMAQI